MSIVSRFAANWQKFLPALVAIGIAAWIALFRNDPTSEQALFAGVLVIYFIHQIEEHLWPGGFRQFTDAHMFHSGDDNWPVIMQALDDIHYSGWGILEVPGGDAARLQFLAQRTDQLFAS